MKNNGKVLGVIPARLAASRFPNKPLKKITNLFFLKKIICTGLKKMELIHQNPGQNTQKKRSNGSINIIEQNFNKNTIKRW